MTFIYAQPTAFTILNEGDVPAVPKGETAPKIALPTSPSKRGNAFEHLILSYYNSVRSLEVKEWSSCLYGESGTLYQCDGILWDGSDRYLLEAKFFEKRPASIQDLRVERRIQAANDLGCDGIVCVSLNGFDESVYRWQKREMSLKILLIDWKALRPHVLARIGTGSASVLLDAFELQDDCIISTTGSQMRVGNKLRYGAPVKGFPEFVSFPDELERWIRRLPGLSVAQTQFGNGHFHYVQETEEVRYIADRKSELSLWEAWQLEDSLLGYSARVYGAMKITADAVEACENQPLQAIQAWLQTQNWKTGETGVRKALDNLILLGFVSKRRKGRRVTYALTPLGKVYVTTQTDAELIFHNQLRQWLPYRILSKAIENRKVEPAQQALITYFNQQYRPYEPYARCLFNENTAYGLLSLYREFGN